MAIYRLETKPFSRGKGQNAVAAAAYRSGEKLEYHNAKENTVEIKDYTRREQVGHTEILTPKNCEWAHDRQALWNAAEAAETRKDSRIAREVLLSLPAELTPEQNREMVKEFVQTQYVQKYGVAADISFHNEEGKNPHCHVLLTTRAVNENGFEAKTQRELNSKENLETWREKWADIQNQKFQEHGHDITVSHLSNEAQGIDRLPSIKLSHAEQVQEAQNPGSTERGRQNEEIKKYNESRKEIDAIESEISDITKQISELHAEKDNTITPKIKIEIEPKRNEKFMQELREYGEQLEAIAGQKQQIVEQYKCEKPQKETSSTEILQAEFSHCFKHNLTPESTRADAVEAFYNRLENNQEAQKERQYLRENGIDISDGIGKINSEVVALKKQQQEMRDEAWKIEKKIKEINAELEKCGIFDGRKKKELTAEYTIQRDKYGQMVEKHNSFVTEKVAPKEQLLTIAQKHSHSFNDSPESRHYNNVIMREKGSYEFRKDELTSNNSMRFQRRQQAKEMEEEIRCRRERENENDRGR